jgi:Protein of unknown function (DUF3631)
MGEKMTTAQAHPIKQTESFITKYATLARDYYTLPLALWAACTHTWPTFDSLAYLVITAFVKRAGKTRLMELMSLVASNGKTFSPDSMASMFRALTENKPTMFLDEAEKLNQEQHPAREFLNKGYKRGQTITRFIGGEVTDFESYCPKCFVLIGDVYDTLRDRAIIVTMRRRTPIEAAKGDKFRMAQVEAEASILRDGLHQLIVDKQAEIEAAYANLPTLSFLNDRDEEIWSPIFAMCQVLCPERWDELVRAAVDMATEKTAPRRSFRDLLDGEEKKADDQDAQILLLRDMLILTDGAKHITSADLVERLKQIPTSPWRMFRGVGLSMQDAAYLLDSMNIHPKPIRVKVGKATKGAIQRGYLRADLLAAAKLVGLR